MVSRSVQHKKQGILIFPDSENTKNIFELNFEFDFWIWIGNIHDKHVNFNQPLNVNIMTKMSIWTNVDHDIHTGGLHRELSNVLF